MANIFDVAKGSRTYIAGSLAVIGAIAAYFTGEMDAVQAAQTGLIALIGMFLRSGITTEVRRLK